MDEIFKNIDVEKRDRIINGALEEFSKNKFDKASTNVIVKNADISKGLLFHYFANKQELYNKLEEFAIDTVKDSIVNNLDWNITDFFERMKQIVMIKGEVTYRYPYIYDFFSIIVEEKTLEKVRENNEEKNKELINRIYTHNIDFSMFRDDIDLDRIMKITNWVFEKFGDELFKSKLTGDKNFNYKEMEIESEIYIEILKKAFYK